MIGLDTSHVPAFTRLFNKELADDPRLGGLRVVAGVKAGNPDFPLSRDRVDGFTREIEQLGVQIVPDIATLLTQVDGVLLQSVDGNQHLEQARPVLEAGVPLFIDKPLAASLPHAQEIARLADQHHVPWFTASSSRFTAGYPRVSSFRLTSSSAIFTGSFVTPASDNISRSAFFKTASSTSLLWRIRPTKTSGVSRLGGIARIQERLHYELKSKPL
jgi:hypothetical protein